MADLASRDYVRYSPSVEKIPPNEADDIRAVAEQINTMQRMQFDNHRHCYTGTHCRTQGIVKGKLIVPNDLPPHLKQGELFAQGGEYPVAARYSTETAAVGIDDRIPQPRGFAMKVFNVKGDMFEAGKDIPTHDIEFNNTPAIELADAKTTREIFDIRIKYGHDQEQLYKQLEKRNDEDLQKARDKVPNIPLESNRYYSQTAYRFGDYIFKYALTPESDVQKNHKTHEVQQDQGSDILHRWTKDFHKNHEAVYLFQVQLCENLEEQPIEYGGVAWDEEKYPFQTVAKVVFPPQDSFDYSRKTFWEDHMRLDPWLGLKAYQPLGSPNRLRREVYPASSSLRRKLNGRQELTVKNVDEIPWGLHSAL